MKYVVVSSAYNEEKYIEGMIKSVLGQSIKPEQLILINDGSTDNTFQIAKKHGIFIHTINTEKRLWKFYSMVRALNRGFKFALKYNPDYILKVDSDGILPIDYAERILERMEKDKKIGIASGKIRNRKMWVNRPSDGAKMYNVACFKDIGFFNYVSAFDTHKIIVANMKGWKTINYSDIVYDELRSSAFKGFKEWYFTGAVRYFLGFPLWHTVGTMITYFNDEPYFFGPLTMFFTHLIFQIRKYKRIFDERYFEYVKLFAYYEIKDRLSDMSKKILRKMA